MKCNKTFNGQLRDKIERTNRNKGDKLKVEKDRERLGQLLWRQS